MLLGGFGGLGGLRGSEDGTLLRVHELTLFLAPPCPSCPLAVLCCHCQTILTA